jgi:hypothetical protein
MIVILVAVIAKPSLAMHSILQLPRVSTALHTMNDREGPDGSVHATNYHDPSFGECHITSPTMQLYVRYREYTGWRCIMCCHSSLIYREREQRVAAGCAA